MNERVVAFRVGIVVLAAGFITGFLIILMGEGRGVFQNRYVVHMRFPYAPGVTVDTPVRKHGVLVGRVTHIELKDEGGVVITARIDAERKLFSDEVPRISTSSILGDAVVEFVPSRDPAEARTPVQDGDFFGNGAVASDPMQVLTNLEGDVRRAVRSFETAAENVSGLTSRLNSALGPEDQLPRLMQRTEMALESFQLTMQSVNELIGDEQVRGRLKQSLEALPATLDDMRLTMGKARESLDGFQRMQVKAEKNLDNIERFTGPLGERGEEMVTNVNSILKNLDVMTAEIADLTQRLKSSDGSLAKFIRDDELYVKVNQTVDNLHEASRRLRPILDSVRIATDKIATDPRQLGLKGALDSKPLGVGLKGVPPRVGEERR